MSTCGSTPAPVVSPKLPSRGGLLPARPPLRTVRESFPSYGSSPHKGAAYCRGMWGDPRRSEKPRLYAVPLGNTECCRNALLLHGAAALRRINRLASVVICFLRTYRFHIFSRHFRPNRRGHIQCITHWPWLFRSSQCCPPDPPCGEVCPVARPGAGVSSLSMFCNVHRMI